MLTEYPCICCGKKIKPLEFQHNLPLQGREEIPPKSPDVVMWDGGIVETIHAGYGSNLDGNKYIIAICDNCAKNKLELTGTYL
jgi:hypothetical protein